MRAHRDENTAKLVIDVVVNDRTYNITFNHNAANAFDADAVTEKVIAAIQAHWDDGYKQKEKEIAWRNRCYREAAKRRANK